MLENNDTYFDVFPNEISIMEGFKEHPDELLQILQIATNCTLTSEQSAVAKNSALELANVKDINVLYLVELWQNTPTLSNFAACIRQVFLPW